MAIIRRMSLWRRSIRRGAPCWSSKRTAALPVRYLPRSRPLTPGRALSACSRRGPSRPAHPSLPSSALARDDEPSSTHRFDTVYGPLPLRPCMPLFRYASALPAVLSSLVADLRPFSLHRTALNLQSATYKVRSAVLSAFFYSRTSTPRLFAHDEGQQESDTKSLLPPQPTPANPSPQLRCLYLHPLSCPFAATDKHVAM